MIEVFLATHLVFHVRVSEVDFTKHFVERKGQENLIQTNWGRTPPSVISGGKVQMHTTSFFHTQVAEYGLSLRMVFGPKCFEMDVYGSLLL